MGRRVSVHACAIPSCGAIISTKMLMCRTHWFMVPGIIRQRVNRAWHQLLSGVPNDYDGVKHVAIIAVEKKLALRKR